MPAASASAARQDALTAHVVTVGGVYRHRRHPGLWRVIEPCRSGSGHVWCLPCDGAGAWNRTEGFHAFRVSELFEPPKLRVKRHYRRRTDG
jgi:hypothetical protein